MGEFLPPEERNDSSLFYLITCSKCHRLMDSPRELECGHIFCEKCLPIVPVEKPTLLLRQFSVVCLECGKYTHIQGKEVRKLPVASWVQILKSYLGSQEKYMSYSKFKSKGANQFTLSLGEIYYLYPSKTTVTSNMIHSLFVTF